MLAQQEPVRLEHPEDRYEASPGWRQAERAVWPLLRGQENDSRRQMRGWYGNSEGAPAGSAASGR